MQTFFIEEVIFCILLSRIYENNYPDNLINSLAEHFFIKSLSQPFLNFVLYRSPKRLDLIKCHESPWVAIRLAERKSIITWGHPQNFKWPRTFVMTSFFVIVLIEICFHRYFTKKFLIWRKWSIVVQHMGHDLSNRDSLSRSSQYISAESIINLIVS